MLRVSVRAENGAESHSPTQHWFRSVFIARRQLERHVYAPLLPLIANHCNLF